MAALMMCKSCGTEQPRGAFPGLDEDVLRCVFCGSTEFSASAPAPPEKRSTNTASRGSKPRGSRDKSSFKKFSGSLELEEVRETRQQTTTRDTRRDEEQALKEASSFILKLTAKSWLLLTPMAFVVAFKKLEESQACERHFASLTSKLALKYATSSVRRFRAMCRASLIVWAVIVGLAGYTLRVYFAQGLYTLEAEVAEENKAKMAANNDSGGGKSGKGINLANAAALVKPGGAGVDLSAAAAMASGGGGQGGGQPIDLEAFSGGEALAPELETMIQGGPDKLSEMGLGNLDSALEKLDPDSVEGRFDEDVAAAVKKNSKLRDALSSLVSEGRTRISRLMFKERVGLPPGKALQLAAMAEGDSELQSVALQLTSITQMLKAELLELGPFIALLDRVQALLLYRKAGGDWLIPAAKLFAVETELNARAQMMTVVLELRSGETLENRIRGMLSASLVVRTARSEAEAEAVLEGGSDDQVKGSSASGIPLALWPIPDEALEIVAALITDDVLWSESAAALIDAGAAALPIARGYLGHSSMDVRERTLKVMLAFTPPFGEVNPALLSLGEYLETGDLEREWRVRLVEELLELEDPLVVSIVVSEYSRHPEDLRSLCQSAIESACSVLQFAVVLRNIDGRALSLISAVLKHHKGPDLTAALATEADNIKSLKARRMCIGLLRGSEGRGAAYALARLTPEVGGDPELYVEILEQLLDQPERIVTLSMEDRELSESLIEAGVRILRYGDTTTLDDAVVLLHRYNAVSAVEILSSVAMRVMTPEVTRLLVVDALCSFMTTDAALALASLADEDPEGSEASQRAGAWLSELLGEQSGSSWESWIEANGRAVKKALVARREAAATNVGGDD
jgi:hypothetical protein